MYTHGDTETIQFILSGVGCVCVLGASEELHRAPGGLQCKSQRQEHRRDPLYEELLCAQSSLRR